MKEKLLRTALSAATEHNDLLRRMEKLTDQLSNTIQGARIDSINTLLQAREAVCKQIAASSSALQRSLAELGAADTAESKGAGGSDLRRALENMQRLLDTAMKKQAACESALAAQLHERKAELIALAQRHGLRSAYQKRQEPTNQARFLDNRL